MPTTTNDHVDLDQINRACNRIAIVVIIVYGVLTAVVFKMFENQREFLLPGERMTALVSATALTASLVMRLITQISMKSGPLAYRSSVAADVIKTDSSVAASGVVNLSYAVTGVAAVTSWLFYLTRVPTLWDPVTGCRTHMLRWCEWTVLAFAMTFLTEIADESCVGSAISLAWSQGLSTACGLLFPLCPGVKSWSFVMALSFFFYFMIFPRWFHRRAVYVAATKAGMLDGRQNLAAAIAKGELSQSVDVVDAMGRLKMSYFLLTTCVILWTVFTLTYFLAGAAKLTGLDPRPSPEWPFVVDAVVDVCAKLIYATVIVDLHGALFDTSVLAERRLAELREVMGVVWTASSDALAVSVRHRLPGDRGFRIETSVSPTAEVMIRANGTVSCGEYDGGGGGGGGVMNGAMEIRAIRFDYDELHGDDEVNVISKATRKEAVAASGLATLMRRAWALGPTDDHILLHELQRDVNLMGGGSGGGSDVVKCESKVTRLGPNRLIVVVRDITEREARYEAEKLLVTETTARERDAAANRFTRHEVKNGLLAAIGLVDGIQEMYERISSLGANSSTPVLAIEAQHNTPALTLAAQESSSLVPEQGLVDPHAVGHEVMMSRWIGELESTLTDTLNSVLSEAMARDLAYDTYIPRPEMVDAVRLLRSGASSGRRFLLETNPAALPPVVLDPQLLHCVHRNAISNACKYGERDGEVVTRLRLRPLSPEARRKATGGTAAASEAFSHELTMEVINKPGPQHDRLLQLDDDTVGKSVFCPGKRLHSEIDLAALPPNAASSAAAVSSGDGGWIMRKCAGSLGGDCAIRFFADCTVFTLRCPTRPAFLATPGAPPVHVLTSGDPGGAPQLLPAAAATAAAAAVGSLGSASFTAVSDAAASSAAAAARDSFKLPHNCWGVAIDDSTMQRKLLARMLPMAGISEKRSVVLGSSAEEIHGFVERVAALVREHPEDYFLIIADENLDVDDAAMMLGRITISGSQCCASLREVLRRENLEAKVLTVVRSANDSAEDVRVYLSRAHGFLNKAPLDRGKFIDALMPLWLARFSALQEDSAGGGEGNPGAGAEDGKTESESGDDATEPSQKRARRAPASAAAMAAWHAESIAASLAAIDGLVAPGSSAEWREICDALHRLRGDLKCVSNSRAVRAAIAQLKSMREDARPDDFEGKWAAVRLFVATL